MRKKVSIFDGDNIKQSNDEIAKEKLSRLNPMVIPLLAVKIKENNKNSFIIQTANCINNTPHKLTDKWINSINKWAETIIDACKLEEPEVENGKRYNFGPLKICKIQEPKFDSEYPMPAIICVDEAGWKWYFKTSKANDFVIGDVISFKATVASSSEGITFLSRPSGITKVVDNTL